MHLWIHTRLQYDPKWNELKKKKKRRNNARDTETMKVNRRLVRLFTSSSFFFLLLLLSICLIGWSLCHHRRHSSTSPVPTYPDRWTIVRTYGVRMFNCFIHFSSYESNACERGGRAIELKCASSLFIFTSFTQLADARPPLLIINGLLTLSI